MYDSNTNTVHPVPEDLTEVYVKRIYDAPPGQALDMVLTAEDRFCPRPGFIRYLELWRKHTDAFQRTPRSDRICLTSISDAQKRLVSTGLPQDLILIMTEQCNMRCSYCVYEEGLYPNRREHRSEFMDLCTAKKAVDLYFAQNIGEMLKPFDQRALNIMFYGGEAFLNWTVVRETISYARATYDGKSQLHIGITTNLTLLEENQLPFLRENDVFLHVSLDGPEEEHDRYRRLAGGGRSFGIIQKKLTLIKSFDPAYYEKYVKSLITVNGNTNFMNVIDFFEKGAGAPPVLMVSKLKDMETGKFHQLHPFDRERFSISFREYIDYYTDALHNGRELKKGDILYAMNYDAMSSFYLAPQSVISTGNWSTGCCVPGRKLAISPDGSIHICERVNPDRPVGHIESGLDEIKLLEYFNAFFASTQDCPSCWARRRCTLCPADVDSGVENYFENRCGKARNNLADTLRHLYSFLEKKPDLFAGEFSYF